MNQYLPEATAPPTAPGSSSSSMLQSEKQSIDVLLYPLCCHEHNHRYLQQLRAKLKWLGRCPRAAKKSADQMFWQTIFRQGTACGDGRHLREKLPRWDRGSSLKGGLPQECDSAAGDGMLLRCEARPGSRAGDLGCREGPPPRGPPFGSSCIVKAAQLASD